MLDELGRLAGLLPRRVMGFSIVLGVPFVLEVFVFTPTGFRVSGLKTEGQPRSDDWLEALCFSRRGRDPTHPVGVGLTV